MTIVALRGGRAGAGVLSEIGSSTSGSSLTGRAPAINKRTSRLVEECLASEVVKRQMFRVCGTYLQSKDHAASYVRLPNTTSKVSG